MELRVIIAGSREFNNYELLKEKCIDRIAAHNPNALPVRIISGTARGADQLGEQFAKEENYLLSKFPADWDKYGKSAGYRRNVEMAKFAIDNRNKGFLVAFWDGKSKGTKWMIDIAKRYGLDVEVVLYVDGE